MDFSSSAEMVDFKFPYLITYGVIYINFKAENVLSMWPFEKGKLKISSQIRRILVYLPESGAVNNLYQIS